VVEDRDVAEDLPAGQNRGDQALARHADVGEGRHLDRRAVGLDLPEHALDLRVEQHPRRRALALDRLLAVRVGAAAGMGKQVEARVFDHDRALEQVGERAADLCDAFAVEHQLGEAPVDLERSLQPQCSALMMRSSSGAIRSMNWTSAAIVKRGRSADLLRSTSRAAACGDRGAGARQGRRRRNRRSADQPDLRAMSSLTEIRW